MIDESKRRSVFARAGGSCEVCGKGTTLHSGQLAHRIPQRKWCIHKWGAEVVHHPLNMAWVCGLACNNIVSIGGWPVACEELVKQIQEVMDE